MERLVESEEASSSSPGKLEVRSFACQVSCAQLWCAQLDVVPPLLRLPPLPAAAGARDLVLRGDHHGDAAEQAELLRHQLVDVEAAAVHPLRRGGATVSVSAGGQDPGDRGQTQARGTVMATAASQSK